MGGTAAAISGIAGVVLKHASKDRRSGGSSQGPTLAQQQAREREQQRKREAEARRKERERKEEALQLSKARRQRQTGRSGMGMASAARQSGLFGRADVLQPGLKGKLGE
ncbi:MAG: hypothetical protein V3573_01810 [Desulfovibrionaceae bacterium]